MRKFILISLMLFSFVFINKAIAQPTINMVSLTLPTFSGATMTGVVTDFGGWTINGVGFIYDTLPMPTRATGAKCKQVAATCVANTSFAYTSASGFYMASGKTYYVRAFAKKTTGGVDTVFSAPMAVITPMPTAPSLQMDSVTSITLQTARIYGTVLLKNNANSFVGKGFIYSNTQNMPTIGNGTNAYTAGTVSVFPTPWFSNIANLYAGQNYFVRSYVIFKYINKSVNDTIYSDTIKFRTLHACGSVPTDVNVDNITVTTARVSFTPAVAQTEWELDYEYAGHAPGTGTTTTTTNDTVDISGLIGNVSYSIFVRAICENNTYSDWSIIKTFTTLPYPCAPITNIYVTEIKHSSAQISWTPGAISQLKWEVCFTKSSQPFPDNGTITTSPTIFLVGLTPQTEYKLKIKALCNDLVSDWSTEYVFSTTISGIEDEAKEDVEKVIIYPNPTNGTINFKAENKENIIKIEIWSSLGELIYTSNKLPETYTLINQSKGLFLVKIFTNDYIQVEKVVLN